MKLAIYVHCYFPRHFYGTEAYTAMLAREATALGHEVTVVAANFPGEPQQASLIERSEWEGVTVYTIDKNVHPNTTIRDTYFQPELRAVHERLLRRIAPDAVHICHLINHTTAVVDAATALGIPIFATFTDFFGFCLNNRLETADGGLCSGPSASRANCVECQLKAIGEPKASALWPGERLTNARRRSLAAKLLAKPGAQVREAYGFDPAEIVARPDHVRQALAAYRAAIAPSAFLKQAYEKDGFAAPLALSHFGIDIDRSPKPASKDPAAVRLAYVGQLAPHKGVHVLLQAMKKAAKANLSLAVYGGASQDPAYFASLRAQAEGMNVSFRGTFPPTRMSEVLGEVDYLVIPSIWYENSPLILLQALATHTPVIVSDVLGLTEFVREGESGFSFARGDWAALSRILAKIADDPELAKVMGAATNYPRTTRNMVEDLLEFVRGHLSAPSARVIGAPSATA